MTRQEKRVEDWGNESTWDYEPKPDYRGMILFSAIAIVVMAVACFVVERYVL